MVSDAKMKKTHCFEVWAHSIDKVFYIQANSKPEMDSWIKAIKEGTEFCVVSSPFGVEHSVHVDFNEAGLVVSKMNIQNIIILFRIFLTPQLGITNGMGGPYQHLWFDHQRN